MKIKLTNEQIRKSLGIGSPSFPKYVSQIINLANQNAQGTRPKVVGQMTELIKEFPGRTLEEWKGWYIKKHPEAIGNAKNKIVDMVDGLKQAVNKIDERMINDWVEDLVIVKTFIGLKLQAAILKKGAELKGSDYRLSDIREESKGIDGYIGTVPVSVKPETYKAKKALKEEISAKFIYYKKIKSGFEIDFSEIFD